MPRKANQSTARETEQLPSKEVNVPGLTWPHVGWIFKLEPAVGGATTALIMKDTVEQGFPEIRVLQTIDSLVQ